MDKSLNKTTPTDNDVAEFIAGLSDSQQQKDSEILAAMMAEVSGQQPVMWGHSIIGFGKLHYTYASGREGDWMKIGFSPRKGKLSLYITNNAEQFLPLLEKMGKYKIGKGCIYITKLEDVDTDVLRELISEAYKDGGIQEELEEKGVVS